MHIIQFAHPGAEFQVSADNSARLPNGEYDVRWNSGSHRRRLVRHAGCYVDHNGELQRGDLLFWTEWEGLTTATILRYTNGQRNAQYLHKVRYPIYFNGTGTDDHSCCQNTDPCVFGASFKYSNCRQDHNVVLRNLSQGSMIAFVSRINGTYYLDTLFVVSERQTYSTDNTNAIDCSEEYRILTLDRLPRHMNYTFYRGRDFSVVHNGDDVGSIFSFSPSRLFSGLDDQQSFRRCALDVDAINSAAGHNVFTSANLRSIKRTASTLNEICRVWQEIVRQVRSQSFVLGVSFDWPTR